MSDYLLLRHLGLPHNYGQMRPAISPFSRNRSAESGSHTVLLQGYADEPTLLCHDTVDGAWRLYGKLKAALERGGSAACYVELWRHTEGESGEVAYEPRPDGTRTKVRYDNSERLERFESTLLRIKGLGP